MVARTSARAGSRPAAPPAPAVITAHQAPSVALDRSAASALRRRRALAAQVAILTDKIKVEDAKLKAFMGDAEEATVKGVKVATWKTTIRTSLSQTLVKKGYPEVAAECTVQTEVRTFKILDD